MTADETRSANEELQRSYRLAFGQPLAQSALADLMRFCCFRRPIETATDEGKRQVFLRIVNMMHLTDQQLYALYGGRALNFTGESDG